MIQNEVEEPNSIAKLKKTKAKKNLDSNSSHMKHHVEIPRLRRIRGQIEGIEKMIQDERYCIDIIQQIKAARSALRSLENSVLKTHLEGCVKGIIKEKSEANANKKIEEIIKLLV